MAMIARAMTITNLALSWTDSEISQRLSVFSDGICFRICKRKHSLLPQNRYCFRHKHTAIHPKSDITRAEVAVMVQRLLQKIEFDIKSHINSFRKTIHRSQFAVWRKHQLSVEYLRRNTLRCASINREAVMEVLHDYPLVIGI